MRLPTDQDWLVGEMSEGRREDRGGEEGASIDKAVDGCD